MLDAVDSNILALNTEIEKLNGALTLCCQIQSEGGNILDTDRYWDLIHSKEHQGMKFHSIAQDYLDYVDQHFRSSFPTSSSYPAKNVITRLLLLCIAFSLFGALAMAVASGNTGEFIRTFINRLLFWTRLKFALPLILGLFLIPAFLISHKNKKYGKAAEYIIKIILAILIFWIGLRKILT